MHAHLRRKAIVSKSSLATYAAACTSMLAVANQANAVVTYVPVNQPVADPAVGGNPVGIDLLFGAVPHHLTMAHGLGTTNAATGYAFMDSNGLGVPGVDGIAGTVVVGPFYTYYYAKKLAYNAAISGQAFLTAAQAAAGVTMAFNAGYGGDEFLAPGEGFIGIKFNTNQFGWVRVNMNGAPLNTYTVVDFAYAGPGEAIKAGEGIPEPSSLAVLALGALGIASWRKSRSKQAV